LPPTTKRYTVLIVPNGGARVRRVQIPALLLPATLAAAFATFAFLGAAAYAYITDHARLQEVASERSALVARTDAQRGQIELFAGRIKELEGRLDQIQALDRKVRAMANLRDQREVATPTPMFGIGGSTVDEERWAFSLYDVEHALRDEMQAELDRLTVEASVQEQSLKELSQTLLTRNLREAHMPAIWPTRGLVTSVFGERSNPITGRRQFHEGLDIATAVGTAVYATADGVVIFAGRHGGLGRMVMISHGNALRTRYAHLSRTTVNVGDRVSRGTKLGTVGMSGSSTGPHLHYEVLKAGVAVNPRRFIE
jgi:murein DD-endopeptidase MepM/ murein hydrolase activator NlpD